MKRSYILLGIVVLILGAALILRLISPVHKQVIQTSVPEQTTMVGNDRDVHGCIGSAGYTWCELKQKCLRSWEEACDTNSTSTNIEVATNTPEATFTTEALVQKPTRNELVSSPLDIQGKVSGSWFFEATLPVKLFDSDNNIIAAGQAKALDDWMTDKPVRFEANLVFETKATSGNLIISKDNPSGLEQNSGFIEVPVRFK